MAGSSSKRTARKRRNPQAQPRAVRSARRELRGARAAGGEERRAAGGEERRAAGAHRSGRRSAGPTVLSGATYRPRRPQGFVGTLGKEGERPSGPFGGVPVSELAILAGIVGAVAGYLKGGGPALVVGIVVCGLGVLELTAREHLSGYRSHTTLLAAFPAAIVEGAIALILGVPRVRVLILVPVIPVFALAFWLLRRRFVAARQRRIAAR